MLKAWVPVRSRVSELCPITYDDIRALDDAWWGLKNALVDRDVEIKSGIYNVCRSTRMPCTQRVSRGP